MAGKDVVPCRVRSDPEAGRGGVIRASRQGLGKQPQKPYSGRMMFRVSPEVHRQAALAAELSGKSLNQWAEEVLDRAAR